MSDLVTGLLGEGIPYLAFGDGRAHIYPAWGHGRTSASPTTAHLSLGFFLAASPR